MKRDSCKRNRGQRPEHGALQGVLRALRVLDIVLASPQGLRLSEVAQQAGLGPSTTHRLLATLVQAGFAEQDPRTRRYRAGRRLAAAAARLLVGLDLVAAAQPVIKRLAEQFNETAHLAVLDGDASLDLNAAESTHSLRVCNPPGGRFPIHCSSTGKVLLAWAPEEVRQEILASPLRRHTDRTITTARGLRQELNRIRSRGYAVDNRECDPYTWCAAAPIWDHAGECVAAVGLSAVASRLSAARRRAACRAVVAAADEVSGALGWSAALGAQVAEKKGAA